MGWQSLDHKQRDAFEKILRMIEAAVKKLPGRRADEDESWPRGSWGEDRSSHVAFLYGARGTGKTTVLASLSEALRRRQVGRADGNARGKDAPEKDAGGEDPQETRVQGIVQEVAPDLVWLETIDMEPMSESINLLAAILVRIEESTRRRGFRPRSQEGPAAYEPRGLLGPAVESHNALMKLQDLQSNIALAWEGNLLQRRARLDPDAYAVEVLRTEKARLQLGPKMEDVLDALAENFHGAGDKGPLFVLPIDDFDLNPPFCLDLLRLLRLISAPRLFTVVLGDLRVAELVLNLKLSKDLGRVAGDVASDANAKMLSVPLSEVAAVASEVAANAIRKLVPPSQRVELTTLSRLSALNFRPLGHRESDPRLSQLLAKRCPVTVRGAVEFLGAPVANLFQLLLRGSSVLGETVPGLPEPAGRLEKGDLDGTVYSALSLLEAPARHITDLWFALDAMGGHDEKGVLDFVAQHCRNTLTEERALSPESRRRVREAVLKTPSGDWKLGELPIAVEPLLGSSRGLEVESHGATSSAKNQKRPQIRVCSGRGWRFETAARDKVARRVLSTETSAALTLFHDLLALESDSHGFESPLLDSAATFDWAVTEWVLGPSLKAVLPWPVPHCSSFWEYDLFVHAWNRVLENVTSLDEKSLPAVVFAWISAGTAVVDGKPVPAAAADPTDKQWEALFQRLQELAKSCKRQGHETVRYVDWLVKVLLLLMPESGLPDAIVEHFLPMPKYKAKAREKDVSAKRDSGEDSPAGEEETAGEEPNARKAKATPSEEELKLGFWRDFLGTETHLRLFRWYRSGRLAEIMIQQMPNLAEKLRTHLPPTTAPPKKELKEKELEAVHTYWHMQVGRDFVKARAEGKVSEEEELGEEPAEV